MPPSYREEVTSIGSLVFLEIARKVKVLVKLIRKNPYACLKKNKTRVVALDQTVLSALFGKPKDVSDRRPDYFHLHPNGTMALHGEFDEKGDHEDDHNRLLSLQWHPWHLSHPSFPSRQ